MTNKIFNVDIDHKSGQDYEVWFFRKNGVKNYKVGRNKVNHIRLLLRRHAISTSIFAAKDRLSVSYYMRDLNNEQKNGS